jgi:hypothetical protein
MFIPILLNGVLEDHYWSYSLIPVYEGGVVAGVYDAFRNTAEDRASWENDFMYEIFGRKPEDGPVKWGRIPERSGAPGFPRGFSTGHGIDSEKSRAVLL